MCDVAFWSCDLNEVLGAGGGGVKEINFLLFFLFILKEQDIFFMGWVSTLTYMLYPYGQKFLKSAHGRVFMRSVPIFTPTGVKKTILMTILKIVYDFVIRQS